MRSMIPLPALLIGTIVLGFALGCGESRPQADRAPANEHSSAEPSAASRGTVDQPAREVRLAVKGMTCEGCVAAVESKLAGVPGVRFVDVSLEDEAATVRCEASVSDEALVAAVAGLNYAAAPMPTRPGVDHGAADHDPGREHGGDQGEHAP